MNEADRLTRLAQLAVEVGANVQPGQYVPVRGRVEHAPLAREIARAAYRVGATLVETGYSDGHFERALIELGPEESLTLSPPGDLAALKDLTDGDIFYIIKNGKGEMTGEGDRSKPDEIWDLVIYVRSLAQKNFTAPAPAKQ